MVSRSSTRAAACAVCLALAAVLVSFSQRAAAAELVSEPLRAIALAVGPHLPDSACSVRRAASDAFGNEASDPCAAPELGQCATRVCDAALGCIAQRWAAARDVLGAMGSGASARRKAAPVKPCAACSAVRFPFRALVAVDVVLAVQVSVPFQPGVVPAAVDMMTHHMNTLELDPRIGMPRFAVVVFGTSGAGCAGGAAATTKGAGWGRCCSAC